jgi:hypothetical protein
MSTLLQVPARNDVPWYKMKITLSNVVYTARLRYNTRMQRWILDLADTADNDILVGLPVLIGRNINGQYVISGLPPGTVYSSDQTQQDTQPTRLSFGTTHILWYSDPTT